MSECARCGAQNQPGARFCHACGALLAAPAPRETRKTVTVVFCDLVGSTPLGEALDPEALRRVLGRYFEEMQEVLERYGGTVEKFIGDAVMAVFGIPTVHADDALRAVRAAAGMRARLASLNDELQRDYGIRLNIRIGITTGEVVAGDPASGQRLVTGDVVNLAKRLEEAAGPNEILIGRATHELVRDAVEAEPLEPIAVKGKTGSTEVLRLGAVDPRAAGVARQFDRPLVGREAELERLQAAFERAVAERRCFVTTVLGEAGIGKSRLAAEVARRLAGRAVVAWGRCPSYGDGITLWALREVVRSLAQHADARARPALERVEALLGEEAGAGEETAGAVRRLLETLAQRRPLLVILEDVHCAESTLLDLVEYLEGWMRDAPALVLCLARPEFGARRPGWLLTRAAGESLDLPPLTEHETERLLDGLRGELDFGGADRGLITAAAEGNPLFVEQLAAMLSEGGEITVPPTIQALLAERLDALDATERAAIECAAVVGREFWRSAVAELADAELRAVLPGALMSLVRKELVLPDDAVVAGDDGFRFAHGLIRDATYEHMPRDARARLHERLAAWIEVHAQDGLHDVDELLGYHLEQAYLHRRTLGRADEDLAPLAARAARPLALAGTRATARGDAPAAIALLERAEPLARVGAPELLPEILLRLGGALRDSGAPLRAQQVLEEAERVSSGTEALRARVEREALRIYLDPTVQVADVRALAERVTPEFEAAGDVAGLSHAWALVADTYWMRCRFGDLDTLLPRVLTYAERAGDDRDRAYVLAMMARVALVGPMPVEAAIARCTALRARGDVSAEARAVVDAVLAVLEAMRGDFDDARSRVLASRSLLEEFGLALTVASLRMYGGMVELLAGDLDAAERELRTGISELERMGERSYRSTTTAFLARTVLAAGRADEAERLARASADLASPDDIVTQAMWRGTQASVLAARGETAEAERLAREAVALAGGTDFLDMQGDLLIELARTLAASGRTREAGAAFAEAVALYERKGDVISAARARGDPVAHA